MKSIFLKLFKSSYNLNELHISYLVDKYGKSGKWLDLGCDDGSWTTNITKKKVEWFGVEVVKHRAELAKKKNITVEVSSLEKKLPFKDNTFTLVHTNQVIEHLFNVDLFISEIYRVLKPGGILVISTENPASWHNIFALILGWQMFSATNISTIKLGIGNPLAIHAGKTFEDTSTGRTSAWSHNKLFTPKALSDLLTLYGFSIVKKLGAGYYPFFSKFGEIDINHSHFYAITATKPTKKNS